MKLLMMAKQRIFTAPRQPLKRRDKRRVNYWLRNREEASKVFAQHCEVYLYNFLFCNNTNVIHLGNFNFHLFFGFHKAQSLCWNIFGFTKYLAECALLYHLGRQISLCTLTQNSGSRNHWRQFSFTRRLTDSRWLHRCLKTTARTRSLKIRPPKD